MATSPYLIPAAVEGDTYPVYLEFTNRITGDSAVPDTLSWTLTDTAGTVINSRNGVSLTPAAAVYVVMSGLDLAVAGATPEDRVLTVSGTYDATYGDNLPIRREFRFQVFPRVVA